MPKVTRTHSRTNAPGAPRPAPTDAHTSAAALIAAAASNRHTGVPDPSETAIAELGKVLAHNDSSARWNRVRQTDAIKMLQGMGWTGASSIALDSLCRRVFGRKSWGSP